MGSNRKKTERPVVHQAMTVIVGESQPPGLSFKGGGSAPGTGIDYDAAWGALYTAAWGTNYTEAWT